MRNILITFFISITCFYNLKAGEVVPDDTLARGQNSKFLAFPFVLRSPETSWGFGLASAYFFKAKLDDKDIRTSDVNLVSLYTLKKQLLIVIGSTVYFPKENYIFRWQSSYSYYPDKFWGIGNQTPFSAEEKYSIKQFFFNPQFLTRLYKKLYIGGNAEYQSVNDFTYTPGGVFDTQQIVGREGGIASGLGFLVTLDSRNNAYSPSKGGFIEFNLTRFDNRFGSNFDFTYYSLELKKFYRIGVNRVLAVQVYGKVNAGEVPIRNLSMLGGSEMMRGFYKGRYSDKNMFTSQAEVRQYLFWRIGVVAFAGTGQVSNDLHQLGWDRMHFSYGGGLRLMVQEKEKLNLRIDYGVGEGRSGVYVILKEAF
jgi:hypothetical protein